ncbi:hypothetical protein A2U01_0088375, partial [Trifolium medium]|nr:hypothetical protein [Trifolium medium]
GEKDETRGTRRKFMGQPSAEVGRWKAERRRRTAEAKRHG